MNLFTKLFLAVALLVPAAAGAEAIDPIAYNPSRSGWYENLKVVSSLSFRPGLQITTLNIGAPDKENQLILKKGNNGAAGTIKTTFIRPTDASDGTSNISLSTATLSTEGVDMAGGNFKAKEGQINLQKAKGLPMYAAKATIPNGKKLQVTGQSAKVLEEAKSETPNEIEGWKLGKNIIPPPPGEVTTANTWCYKWAVINEKKVLALTKSCN